MRKNLIYTIAIILILLYNKINSQPIVVSEYYNSSPTPDLEWTELLVIQDDISIVGYTLRDNAGTSDLNAWQGGVRFKDDPLWKHLRSGTIIVIYHRAMPFTIVQDVDKRDGYIELSALNSTYLEQRMFASGDWNSKALNIAANADILQIIDASDNHVHCLAHMANPIGDYLNISGPKVAHQNSTTNGGSVRVVPGLTIDSYNSGLGITQTAESSSNITKGLPNNSNTSNDQNQIFWRSLRQPNWNNPNLSVNYQITTHNFQLTWNQAIDPYPGDISQGYLVCIIPYDSINKFFAPVDGKIYNIGDTIGPGKVITINIGTDNNTVNGNYILNCGERFIIRVYAFRYRADDNMMDINMPKNARGRSYNETQFASGEISLPNPITPVLYTNKSFVICNGDSVLIKVNPSNINYQYRWTYNSSPLLSNTDSMLTAYLPGKYSVTIIDKNNCASTSDEIRVEIYPFPSVNININNMNINSDTIIHICNNSEISVIAQTTDRLYWYKDGTRILNTSNLLKIKAEGIYYAVVSNNAYCIDTSYKVTVKYYSSNEKIYKDTIKFSLNLATPTYSDIVTVYNLNSLDELFIDSLSYPHTISVVGTSKNIIINDSDQYDIRFNITPDIGGNYSEKIIVNFPCNRYDTIYIVGYKETGSIMSSKSSIDLRTLNLCKKNDIKMDSIILKNSSLSKITIYSPIITPTAQFTITPSFINYDLNVNNEIKIFITYSTINIEDINTKIKFPYVSNYITDTMSINLLAGSAYPSFSVKPDTIENYFSDCESVKDTVITIENTGLFDILIDETSLLPNLVAKITPIFIPAGEYLDVPIQIIQKLKKLVINNDVNITLNDCQSIAPIVKKLVLTGSKGIDYIFSKSEVNFGDVVFCKDENVIKQTFDLDLIKDIHITNPVITSITIDPPFFVDDIIGKELGKNNTLNVYLNNASTGNLSTTLKIKINDCDTIFLIPVGVNSKKMSLDLSVPALNYGNVETNSDSSIDLKLSNNLFNNIIIKKIDILNLPYNILNYNGTQIDLKSNTDSMLRVMYKPTIAGSNNDTIRIYITYPCDTIISIPISGKGVQGGNVLITTTIPNITVKPGDQFTIPVNIISSDMLLNSFTIDSSMIILKYNPTMLMPKDVAIGEAVNPLAGVISYIENPIGTLYIKSVYNNKVLISNGVLASIECLALLGDAFTCNIEPDTIIFYANRRSNIISENGILTIAGACDLEHRLIDLNGNAELKLIRNDISSDIAEIDYSVPSEELTEIILYDSFGNSVATVEKDYLKPNNYKKIIVLNNYSSGIYYVVMRSGIINRTIKFIILK